MLVLLGSGALIGGLLWAAHVSQKPSSTRKNTDPTSRTTAGGLTFSSKPAGGAAVHATPPNGQFGRTKVTRRQLTQRSIPKELTARTYAMVDLKVPGMGNVSMEAAIQKRNSDRKNNGQSLVSTAPVTLHETRTQALLLAGSSNSSIDPNTLFSDERFRAARESVDHQLQRGSFMAIRATESQNERAFLTAASNDTPPPFVLPNGATTLPVFFTIWVPERLSWQNEYDSGGYGTPRTQAPIGARGELTAGLYTCRTVGVRYAQHDLDSYSYGTAIVFREGFPIEGRFDNDDGYRSSGVPPISQAQLVSAIERGDALVYAASLYENQLSALLVPSSANESFVREWFAGFPRLMSKGASSDPHSESYKDYDLDPMIASITIQQINGRSSHALDRLEKRLFSQEGDTRQTRTWMSFFYHPEWGVVRDTARHLKWRKEGLDTFEGIIIN